MIIEDGTAGSQWVGGLNLGNTADFIRLDFRTGHSPVLDRPGRFLFQMPLQDMDINPDAIRFKVGSLAFEGAVDGERFSGTVVDDGSTGTFDLRRVHKLARGDYLGLLGHYQLGADREIMLGQDDRADLQLYFYVDGEQVVRLHPVESNRFYSERCESITVSRDAQGIAHSLTWQADGSDSLDAPRVRWHREEQVRIPVDDYILAGTLLLPPGDGPHPAVMLCHHADTHQRDYYRLFAESFVERGLAALIYDKRGWGDSTGPQLFSQIFQLADDASAVYLFLQNHPAIRPDAVGIWGISNGAWVTCLTASRVGDAAFVIGASLAGVTPARQEQIRRVNVVRELGASPRAAALIDRLWALLFKFFVDGRWNEEVESILKQVYADEELQRLPKHPEHGPNLQPVPPFYPIDEIKADGGTWQEGDFDPAPVYASLRCPILVVWGEQDTVLPLQESVQRMEQALAASNHPHFRLHVISDATHKLYTLSPEPVGMLADTIQTHLHNVSIAAGVRELMAEWAASCMGKPAMAGAGK